MARGQTEAERERVKQWSWLLAEAGCRCRAIKGRNANRVYVYVWPALCWAAYKWQRAAPASVTPKTSDAAMEEEEEMNG